MSRNRKNSAPLFLLGHIVFVAPELVCPSVRPRTQRRALSRRFFFIWTVLSVEGGVNVVWGRSVDAQVGGAGTVGPGGSSG